MMIKDCANFLMEPIKVALSNEELSKKTQESKDLTLNEKITLGVSEGLKIHARFWIVFIPINILVLGVAKTVNISMGKPAYSEGPSFFDEVLYNCFIQSIYEEVLFRGIFQNGVFLLQKGVNNITPTYFSKSRTFQWLISPSVRILTVSTIHAMFHGSLVTKLFYSLTPVMSIIHETTGNLIAPISTHITINLTYSVGVRLFRIFSSVV